MRFRKNFRNVTLIIVLLLFFLLVWNRNRKSTTTDYYIATTELNVRTGPGTGYSVSFTLREGAEVELLSKETSWFEIQYFGKTGYAHAKFLEFSRTTKGISIGTKSISPQEIVNKVLIGLYIVLALFIIYFIYSKVRDKHSLERVTHSGRGTSSERDLVLKLLKCGIPAERIFHDLYVEKYKDHFAQVDLVAVTEVGIIVFEVKEYSGWIYGSGNQQKWTKVLNYGKEKYRFYNPIMQNNKHISELKKQLLQFYYVPLYSVVVFYGSCKLKEIDFVPEGTFVAKSERVLEVIKKILKENYSVSYINENEVLRILREAVINGGIIENQIKHRANIKDMLGEHRVFD
jgi:hypothetical protein